jgi:hypothetical protein
MYRCCICEDVLYSQQALNDHICTEHAEHEEGR